MGDNDTEKFNLKNLQRTIIDHDKDMKVQESLWRQVLVASSLKLIVVGSSSDESSDEDQANNLEEKFNL